VLLEKLGGMTFEITPLSFFQVNTEQTEALYRKALEAAALTGTETVFDLYCGIGTISLLAARKAKQVIGVEVVEEAVESAEENARRNRVENVAFHAGTAETVVPALYAEGVKADVVIVDPPRKGCDATLLQTILEMQPDRIVYVSCNPSTLARDLKVLCGERTNAAGNGSAGDAGGEPVGETRHDSVGETGDGKPVYRVQSVQPVDMFPWTEHVETVVLLSHKKADTHINVNVEFGEGEGKIPVSKIVEKAEDYRPSERVTYKMIQEYIESKYGFKVHTSYIAEVKRDLGLPMYDAPNAVEELKNPRKHPTIEKVEAIKDALKHFEVIY
jgi:23S rRNA (uracil1939-C5)-methyltransferase